LTSRTAYVEKCTGSGKGTSTANEEGWVGLGLFFWGTGTLLLQKDRAGGGRPKTCKALGSRERNFSAHKLRGGVLGVGGVLGFINPVQTMEKKQKIRDSTH